MNPVTTCYTLADEVIYNYPVGLLNKMAEQTPMIAEQLRALITDTVNAAVATSV